MIQLDDESMDSKSQGQVFQTKHNKLECVASLITMMKSGKKDQNI